MLNTNLATKIDIAQAKANLKADIIGLEARLIKLAVQVQYL